jgi:hypothetical protein
MLKQLGFLLSALVMLALIGTPALGAPWEIRSGNAVVAAGQTVTGDLIFTGDTLEIAGEVQGDLLVFANEVIVNGRVGGSILGMVAAKLTVNGVVAGNIRTAAGHMELHGKVERSISSYALRFNTARRSVVAHGILGTFRELTLDGTVNGPVEVNVYEQNLIGGTIDGDLIVRGASPQWRPPARITGRVIDYSVTAQKAPPLPQTVQAGKGYLRRRPLTDAAYYYKMWLVASLIWFIGSLLLTLIFYRIFPRTAWWLTQTSPAAFKQSLFAGFLTLVGVPLLILLLLVSVVGIPIALVLFLLYLVLLIFANIPVSILAGRLLLRQYDAAGPARPNWLIIIGSFLVSLVGTLPVLGWILTTCLGMGMIVRQFHPEFDEGH